MRDGPPDSYYDPPEPDIETCANEDCCAEVERGTTCECGTYCLSEQDHRDEARIIRAELAAEGYYDEPDEPWPGAWA